MEKIGWLALIWLVLVGAAVLEVGGDAAVRRGLRGGAALPVVAGCLLLAVYGVLINTVRWDFSKLLGVYVAVFALVSLLCGQFLFKEEVPTSSWVGLGLIVVGGLVIQFGQK